MGGRRDRGFEWDDDPVGSVDHGKNRRWRRGWHMYAAYLVGAVGVLLLIGAVGAGAVTGVVAAGCLLGASAALVRADGPRATNRAPRPRVPTAREELGWYAAAVVLVVVGLLLSAV